MASSSRVSRPVTIKDVAARVGLSYATVSRALNDKYGVNPATRERVLSAARQMRYTPNAIARGLITRRTRTIGLIVPDLSNPFFPEVAAGIEEEAEAAGYGVLLCSSRWSHEREDAYLRLLVERRVDALIVAPVARPRGRRRLLVPTDLPCVFVSSSPPRARRNSVTVDNELGGYLATEHLLSRRYRPVAFLGAADGSDTGGERLAGYRRALESARLAFRPGLVFLDDFDAAGASRSARRMLLMKRRPRSVFCENDVLAVTAIQCARESGLRVPEDLAVIGFDDIPLAKLYSVELTTIAQPIREMGREALAMALRRIESGRHEPAITLEPRLVVRHTT